jgi:ABC-type phosphate transport system permease subunit
VSSAIRTANRAGHDSVGRLLRQWPRLTVLVIAAIPTLVLVLISASLALQSSFVVREKGLDYLFATQFSRDGTVPMGLTPAIYGTFLMVAISLALGLPISLAIAIFSSEYTLGPLGKSMRGLMGGLSGIPPIVYAAMSIVLAEVFIRPKFCLLSVPPDIARSLPAELGQIANSAQNQSTLLGGFVVALMMIPFVTPIIDDAIRSVPRDLREASLALGAGRWHTLTRVVLPLALPGIASSVSLGVLKAMGDVLIVLWVVGQTPALPTPMFDVLQASAPLTATGAGLFGGVDPETMGQERALEFSVGSSAGLLLLVIALGILVLTDLVQKRLQRKLLG